MSGMLPSIARAAILGIARSSTTITLVMLTHGIG
jgi:hypothetical protein